MNSIKIEISKCDMLASRFYEVGARDKQRAAGDWLDQVKKAAKVIKMGQINSTSNKKEKNAK